LSSDAFYIALNRGLSDENFEFSVQALAVPEAPTWAMLSVGSLLLAFVRRRTPMTGDTRG
jgi:hypothetical protein